MRSAFALMAATCAALAGAACAESPVAGTPAAILPTPCSAEQIREAWQAGLRVEMRSTAGVVSSQRMTVLAATPETGTIRSEALDAHGVLTAPAEESTVKWSELRDHALFPADKATRGRAECRSRLGVMQGWRYSIPQANGDTLAMCFADATPGPPVEIELKRGEQVVSRTEHTSYERPASGAEEKQ